MNIRVYYDRNGEIVTMRCAYIIHSATIKDSFTLVDRNGDVLVSMEYADVLRIEADGI